MNPPITPPQTLPVEPIKAPQLDKQPAETQAPEPFPIAPEAETRKLKPLETAGLQAITIPRILAKPAAMLVVPENVRDRPLRL